jgi:hypothetical protein
LTKIDTADSSAATTPPFQVILNWMELLKT